MVLFSSFNVLYIFYFIGTTTYEINGCEIIHLWDPPHLEKNSRNNDMVKWLAYWVNGEKFFVHIWSVIVLAYEMDLLLNTGKRRLRKITDAHIYEGKIPKMRVKPAVQVCSITFAEWIEELARLGSENLVD